MWLHAGEGNVTNGLFLNDLSSFYELLSPGRSQEAPPFRPWRAGWSWGVSSSACTSYTSNSPGSSQWQQWRCLRICRGRGTGSPGTPARGTLSPQGSRGCRGLMKNGCFPVCSCFVTFYIMVEEYFSSSFLNIHGSLKYVNIYCHYWLGVSIHFRP